MRKERKTVGEMLAELNAAGVANLAVAKACGVHPNTIYLISCGLTLNPGYMLGRQIEDLWQVLCAPQDTVIPDAVRSQDG